MDEAESDITTRDVALCMNVDKHKDKHQGRAERQGKEHVQRQCFESTIMAKHERETVHRAMKTTFMINLGANRRTRRRKTIRMTRANGVA